MHRAIGLAATLLLFGCSGGSGPPPFTPPMAKVAIYGDSIVAGMVGKKLVPPFDNAVIAGVGGQATPEIADRVGPYAQYVFLEGGINDLAGQPREPILTAYARMLSKLTSVQARIIGILHVDRTAIGNNPVTNTQIDAINAQLVALCKTYMNCVPALEAMQMDVTGLTVDGVHLTQDGYTALTTALAKYVP